MFYVRRVSCVLSNIALNAFAHDGFGRAARGRPSPGGVRRSPESSKSLFLGVVYEDRAVHRYKSKHDHSVARQCVIVPGLVFTALPVYGPSRQVEIVWNVLELDWEGASAALGSRDLLESFCEFLPLPQPTPFQRY